MVPLLRWWPVLMFLMATAIYYFIISLSLAIGMLPFLLGLAAIQDLLGHASLSTTQVYTAVDQARLMEAYEKAHPKA